MCLTANVCTWLISFGLRLTVTLRLVYYAKPKLKPSEEVFMVVKLYPKNPYFQNKITAWYSENLSIFKVSRMVIKMQQRIHELNVMLLKKLHRMRATGDFKNFFSFQSAQRKRDVLIQWRTYSVKYSFSEVLIQWSSHSLKYSFS